MTSRAFFFNDTATTEIYTLSLHDALPICPAVGEAAGHGDAKPRSHIAGGRASTENFVGGKGLEGDYKKKQDWDAHRESVK